MSIYKKQDFVPMLLGESKTPFDDPDYIFEIKFDGIRTLIFAEPNKITLRNKRSDILNNRYPELLNINKNIKHKVIFDGEIISMVSGKPSFEKLQERVLLKNQMKINYQVENNPVTFIAYDILYENKDITSKTLIERKKILSKYNDTSNFIKAQFFEKNGIDLYNIVCKQELEGIVAKKKNSSYHINKRSKDWIKIKYLKDDDFFICGYKEEDNKAMASLLLGNKIKNKLIFAGTVNIGKKNTDLIKIKNLPIDEKPEIKKENYINIIPSLECTITFMEKTKKGFIRQPVYKSLKE